jgi:hypothetical protein
VFLGLTLGCARCHNHKFDPISQKEYYQLFAFLNNQSEPTLNIASPEVAAKREEIQAKMDKIEEALDVQIKEVFTKLPAADKDKIKDNIAMILNLRPDQRTEMQKKTLAKFFQDKGPGLKKDFMELETLKKQMPKFPTTLVLQELSKPRPTYIHIQGDFTRKGDKVEPGVPAILHPLAPKSGKTPNRLDLAYWLVDAKNPLLGRVTVNRLWQHYFGKGLVETENDFGTQGSSPSHPELLDWLATEFLQQGWSLKKMHRLIVTSATYRQSSKVRPDLAKLDPYNKLLARQARLRLDAELVRDSALAASGLLNLKIGGPSVFPPQPAGVYAFTQVNYQWKSTGDDRYRRGLYTFLQRSAPYPGLTVFDAPDGNSSCTRRVRSNTPLQALTLLNDKTFLEFAHGLAYRVLKEGPTDDKGRLEFAFRLTLIRKPAAWELAKLEKFLQQQVKQYEAVPEKIATALLKAEPGAGVNLLECDLPAEISVCERAAWTTVTRVLMNLDEFITRE